MKKYIAPEMEIAKFSAEDVITTSVVVEKIEVAGDGSYSFGSESAIYGEF